MKKFSTLAFGLLMAGGAYAQTTTLTTAQIMAASLSPACLDYRVVGACFWLICGWGCHVETSPKICHNLPDLVVSVHGRPEHNPWVEMTGLSAAAAAAGGAQLGTPLDGGTRTEGNTAVQKENQGLFTRDVSVIGNPVIAATDGFGDQYLCRSTATPFQPYLLTPLDAWAWRAGLTEMIYPATWTPGLREIGPWPASTWGSVHPRIGAVRHTDDPIAGAVAAQRAVDIVTRPGQPHVYWPLPGQPSQEMTDRWQSLAPVALPDCETFGSPNPAWSGVHATADGAAVWAYWREYECCIPRPGKLIATVGGCPPKIPLYR